jgi:hypothetical protein
VPTEYWADGPKSETPPGHWYKIANDVSDDLTDLRLGGTGQGGGGTSGKGSDQGQQGGLAQGGYEHRSKSPKTEIGAG